MAGQSPCQAKASTRSSGAGVLWANLTARMIRALIGGKHPNGYGLAEHPCPGLPRLDGEIAAGARSTAVARRAPSSSSLVLLANCILRGFHFPPGHSMPNCIRITRRCRRQSHTSGRNPPPAGRAGRWPREVRVGSAAHFHPPPSPSPHRRTGPPAPSSGG
jgi:hypothetical protein